MSGASTVTLPAGARPAAEALAVYCKRPATETVEELLGPDAVKAILSAPSPSNPAPRRPLRASLSLAAIAIALAGIALPISAGAFIALFLPTAAVALIAGKPWIDHVRDRYMNRHELSRADLAGLAGNAAQKRNLHSLEEFRRQLGNGTLKAYSVSPAGSPRPLAGHDLACFVADHGRILLVSVDHNDWAKVRARPLPRGEVWIDLGGVIARTQLTAKTLIDEPNEERYQLRIDWIRDRAMERGQFTGALISGLAIIDALRHPEVRSQPFTKAMPAIKAVLRGPAASDSVITKMNSGNYAEFETALHALPLEELP